MSRHVVSALLVLALLALPRAWGQEGDILATPEIEVLTPGGTSTSPTTLTPQTSTPVTEPSTPGTEPGTPGTVPAAPVTESTAPVTEPTTPVTEPTTPVTEPTVPVTTVVTPVPETTEPEMEPVTEVHAPQEFNGTADLNVILDCLAADGNFTIFLRHFHQSGFADILGKYLSFQAITLLVPTDTAFNALPWSIKQRMVNSPRIKLLEFHMLKELMPLDYFKAVLPEAFFETVLSESTGPFIHRQRSDTKDIVLGACEDATRVATVIKGNACGLPSVTVAVQAIDRVLLPPGVFDTSAQTYR